MKTTKTNDSMAEIEDLVLAARDNDKDKVKSKLESVLSKKLKDRIKKTLAKQD